MRTKDHRIEVRDGLQHGVSRFESDCSVTFPVLPPVRGVAEDVGGGFVRLHQDEGWIEVRLTKDGRGIEVRGAQSLVFRPHSSNSVDVYVADDVEWSEANEPKLAR
jgi:hypothetical protein